MKHIYFLYTSYCPNTAETNRALSYLASLEKYGIDIDVIFFMPDKYRSKVSRDYKHIKIHYLWKWFPTTNKYLKYIPYVINIIRFRLSLRSGDVIYMYNLNDIKRLFVKIKNIKTFHESTECPEISLMPNVLHKCSIKEHLKTCKKMDGLFVISQALKQYYVMQGIESSKIHIINMTVDVSRFNNITKSKEVSVNPYIAYCGKISNNKDGVDHLIRAFSIVHEKYPKLKLVIIGDVPKNQNIENNMLLIEKLGLKDSIILTGKVEAEKIPQMLVNAIALLLARPDNKQAKYGFPTKLGEYLLSATPVVVTAVGDIPLFLEDKNNALISEPENDKMFADKILWIMEHPKEAVQIGKKGKEIALQNFNSDIEIMKLLSIINAK